MSSLNNQITRCLDEIFMNKAQIEAMKTERGIHGSLKRSLRPGGDPTKILPYILSCESYSSYAKAGLTFFRRAKALYGINTLRDLLAREVLLGVFNQYYRHLSPGYVSRIQCAIKHIYSGAQALGWVHGACPIDNEFRAALDICYRPRRYGYPPQDAVRIVRYCYEQHSRAALAIKIALCCGLRAKEVAGFRGEQVDRNGLFLRDIAGKGGRLRDVPLPASLLPEMTRKQGYYFTPSRSFRTYLRRETSRAARALGMDDTGFHRLRSTYATLIYTKCRGLDGKSDREARREVSGLLGHNRISVTYHYVPEQVDWEKWMDYIYIVTNGF